MYICTYICTDMNKCVCLCGCVLVCVYAVVLESMAREDRSYYSFLVWFGFNDYFSEYRTKDIL